MNKIEHKLNIFEYIVCKIKICIIFAEKLFIISK